MRLRAAMGARTIAHRAPGTEPSILHEGDGRACPALGGARFTEEQNHDKHHLTVSEEGRTVSIVAMASGAHRVGPVTSLPCRMSCSLNARKLVCVSHVSV